MQRPGEHLSATEEYVSLLDAFDALDRSPTAMPMWRGS